MIVSDSIQLRVSIQVSFSTRLATPLQAMLMEVQLSCVLGMAAVAAVHDFE